MVGGWSLVDLNRQSVHLHSGFQKKFLIFQKKNSEIILGNQKIKDQIKSKKTNDIQWMCQTFEKKIANF